MKTLRKISSAAVLATTLSCCFTLTAFALSEGDVQAQVEAAGKEAVSGNVLIWFLCAIAFLKVSQKIDSFLSSLGIHVGNTGGSMLAEAMIAAKGIGGIRNFSSRYFGGGRSSSSTHMNTGGSPGPSGGFMAGGLAGIVSRSVTNSAIRSATSPSNTKAGGSKNPNSSGGPGSLIGGTGGIGGYMYASSVSKGGGFANNVVGTVATGSLAAYGSITGEKAAQALHSYMGFAALEEGAKNVPSFSNVEIGGGRITGTETSEEHPEGIAFSMYHTGQYMAPDGAYTTVHAADGTAWYKQYAADTVDKSPYMAPDGSIAYKESIVKKLPPTPKRKDRI